MYISVLLYLHSEPGTPEMYRFPILYVHSVYVLWMGAGKRAPNNESIYLKTSSPYCLCLSSHFRQGCHIQNTSKTKKVKCLATVISSFHRRIFKNSASSLCNPLVLPRKLKSKSAQYTKKQHKSLSVSSPKRSFANYLSWQYYLAFSLFPVLANRCPPHYSAFSSLREGSGLTLPTLHYRKSQHISYLALRFNHKTGSPTLVINGETFSTSSRQALNLTMTLSGEGQNIQSHFKDKIMSILETIQLKTLKINISSSQPISAIFQACNLENAGQAQTSLAQFNEQTRFSIDYKLQKRKLHSETGQKGIRIIEPHGHKTTHYCCETVTG